MSSGTLGGRGPLRRLRSRRSLNGLVVQLSAIALSFVLVALLVVTSSHQAFVAATHDDGNRVGAAQIDLTDDDRESAMFDEQHLTPDGPAVRCITVTYTGTEDPDWVRLYMPTPPTDDLAPYLDLTVDVGPPSGDAFGTCADFHEDRNVYSGTLPDFATGHPTYASGLPVWDPGHTGEQETFRFTVAVHDDQAAQGKTTTFGFTWETDLS
jgi:hypothetical protein